MRKTQEKYGKIGSGRVVLGQWSKEEQEDDKYEVADRFVITKLNFTGKTPVLLYGISSFL